MRPGPVGAPALLSRRQWNVEKQTAAGLAFDHGSVTIPLASDLILDELGRNTRRHDSIGIGFCFSLNCSGLSIAICLRNDLLGLCFLLSKFVLDTNGILGSLDLVVQGLHDLRWENEVPNYTELLDDNPVINRSGVDPCFHLGDESFFLHRVDLLNGVGRGLFVESVASDVVKKAVSEAVQIIGSELRKECRHLVGLEIVAQRNRSRNRHTFGGKSNCLFVLPCRSLNGCLEFVDARSDGVIHCHPHPQRFHIHSLASTVKMDLDADPARLDASTARSHCNGNAKRHDEGGFVTAVHSTRDRHDGFLRRVDARHNQTDHDSKTRDNAEITLGADEPKRNVQGKEEQRRTDEVQTNRSVIHGLPRFSLIESGVLDLLMTLE